MCLQLIFFLQESDVDALEKYLRSLHVPAVLGPDKEHWPGAAIYERGMISLRN
jgi:hypothetical protein